MHRAYIFSIEYYTNNSICNTLERLYEIEYYAKSTTCRIVCKEYKL